MACVPPRTILACFRISGNNSGRLFAPSSASKLIKDGEFTWSPWFLNFSTGSLRKGSSLRDRSREVLLTRLRAALDDQKRELAWEAFSSFRKLYGFPEISITSRLITNLAYSSDPRWLQNAFDLVFLYLRKKSGLFQLEVLAKLALSLARAQLPLPASRVLRLLLEKNCLPPLNVMSSIVLHMVKTEAGTCLASNFLIQLCSDLSNKTKPDTLIFNIVLNACVRFESSLKALQLIELMASIGVVANADSLIIFSRVHDMNGLRDEIVKYKDFVDQVSNLSLLRKYRQFYDCLLSLHFKFNDVDSAAKLVQDIYRDKGCLLMTELRCQFVPIGSHNLKTGLRIMVDPGKVDEDCSIVLENKEKYIVFRDGKFDISYLTLAKLIHRYRKNGFVDELSKFLISIGNHISLLDIIDACIHIGWLETAHDILDDLESAGSSVDLMVYISLLEAYSYKGMKREVNGLVKQMLKAGLISDVPNEMDISTLLEKDRAERSVGFSCSTRIMDLADLLIQEMQEKEEVPPMVYDVNSSLYFFCKAKMMEDALRTYRRMLEMKTLSEQTFATMLNGYSSLKMYRDVTILWGDIKRNIRNGNLTISQDLYESLLVNFIRGGYFERVMEVIIIMEEKNMLVDKGMCMWEYQKLHKNLYRRLKASEATTEAQKQRLQFVKEFRKWMFSDLHFVATPVSLITTASGKQLNQLPTACD
ncbi:hypothetical protein SAY86_028496 [Trapa natans]|uniref:At1g68980-like TPR repeats domain-containing protein n=1 Tax=Trapa natans TaxID=22666 RepID=A0AAN7LZT7_TRANT|nr:hypothetical protein SAY86_028496 [Trapa natans]